MKIRLIHGQKLGLIVDLKPLTGARADGYAIGVQFPIAQRNGKITRLGEVRTTSSRSTDFQMQLPQRPKRALINYHHDILAVESLSVGN